VKNFYVNALNGILFYQIYFNYKLNYLAR